MARMYALISEIKMFAAMQRKMVNRGQKPLASFESDGKVIYDPWHDEKGRSLSDDEVRTIYGAEDIDSFTDRVITILCTSHKIHRYVEIADLADTIRCFLDDDTMSEDKKLRIIKARAEDIRRIADMCLAYDVEDRKEEKTDETA